MGVGTEECLTVVSLVTWVGYCNASMTFVWRFGGPCENGGATNCCGKSRILAETLTSKRSSFTCIAIS